MSKALRFKDESIVSFNRAGKGCPLCKGNGERSCDCTYLGEKLLEEGHFSKTYGFFTYQDTQSFLADGGVAILPNGDEVTAEFIAALVDSVDGFIGDEAVISGDDYVYPVEQQKKRMP
jgi:hypothetical protein